MATKKKSKQDREYDARQELKTCSRCQLTSSGYFFNSSSDRCDRCLDGSNDWYLERKAGREERIAKALLEIEDPSNWCNCGVVAAYARNSVASHENRWQFDAAERVEKVSEETHAVVGNPSSGSIERKVEPDFEEGGAWPPDEVVQGVF